MKMIIELSKDVYDDIKYRFKKQDYECGYIVASAIVFGTPLEEELGDIRAKIEKYKSTIDKAVSEDELKIEGMKEAYTDCLNILDEYKVKMKGDK